MNLLVGPSSVESLSQLSKAYQRIMINRSEKYLNLKIKKFHPILGNRQLIDIITREDLIQLLNSPSGTNLTDEVFKIKARIFNELGGRNLFFPEKENIELLNYHLITNLLDEVEQAKLLIHNSIPWMGKLLDLLISDIWFLQQQNKVRFLGGGGSNYTTLGLFTMSFRPYSEFSDLELAISFAHELGHNCFYLIQAGEIPISKESWGEWVYSGVRKVQRPAYASFHAAVALTFMLEAAKGLIANPKIATNTERLNFLTTKNTQLRKDLILALEALRSLKLTDTGKIVYFEMIECLN